MATKGEWADHVMLLAAAKAIRNKIEVYSQTRKIVGRGEELVIQGSHMVSGTQCPAESDPVKK